MDLENSLLLAKFWGFYLIIFFVVLSFNPNRIRTILDYLKDPKFLHLVAFITIVTGLLNILFHNVWTDDWRLIITVIGWVSLILGIMLFMFPARAARALRPGNVKLLQLLYVLLFLLGLYLMNMGFEIFDF